MSAAACGPRDDRCQGSSANDPTDDGAELCAAVHSLHEFRVKHPDMVTQVAMFCTAIMHSTDTALSLKERDDALERATAAADEMSSVAAATASGGDHTSPAFQATLLEDAQTQARLLREERAQRADARAFLKKEMAALNARLEAHRTDPTAVAAARKGRQLVLEEPVGTSVEVFQKLNAAFVAARELAAGSDVGRGSAAGAGEGIGASK